MFSHGPKKSLEETILQTPQAKSVASQFTIFRATQHLLARSDLEMVSGSDLQPAKVEVQNRKLGITAQERRA